MGCQQSFGPLSTLIAVANCGVVLLVTFLTCHLAATIFNFVGAGAIEAQPLSKQNRPSFSQINNFGTVKGLVPCRVTIHTRWLACVILLLCVVHTEWGLISLSVIASVSIILLISVIWFTDRISSSPESQCFCQFIKGPIFK